MGSGASSGDGSPVFRHPPLDEIVVVAIDESSLEHMGAWPWSRAVYAQLVDRLAAAGAKTIVLTVPLDTAQPDRALPYLQKIRSLLQAAPPEAAALNEQLGRTVAEAEAALDADARLAASMARAGNVLLPTELVTAPCPRMCTAVPCPIRVVESPRRPERARNPSRCSGRLRQALATCP